MNNSLLITLFCLFSCLTESFFEKLPSYFSLMYFIFFYPVFLFVCFKNCSPEIIFSSVFKLGALLWPEKLNGQRMYFLLLFSSALALQYSIFLNCNHPLRSHHTTQSSSYLISYLNNERETPLWLGKEKLGSHSLKLRHKLTTFERLYVYNKQIPY